MIYRFGHNDYLCLGAGWHPLQEGPGGVACRWMSPRATVRIPDEEQSVTGIIVKVTAPQTINGHAPGLSVYRDNRLLGHCADLGLECHWTDIHIPFDCPPLAGDQELTFVVEHRAGDLVTPLTFLPNLVLGNGDIRELGIQAAQLQFTSQA